MMPSDWTEHVRIWALGYQSMFSDIMHLISCPLIMILLASLQPITVPEKKEICRGILAFTLPFAIAV